MVAAIITDHYGKILSTGYNGVPSGITHCTESACPGVFQEHGDTSKCLAVHAEQNAIIQCADLSRARIMYCSCTPCFVCAKMILNTPIEALVCQTKYNDEQALDILIRRGMRVYVAETDEQL